MRTVDFYESTPGFPVREIGGDGWRKLVKDRCRIMVGQCPVVVPAGGLWDRPYFAYLIVEGIDGHYGKSREVSS